MDWTELQYDVTDHIATIALNRPEKLNAGTPTMVGELLAAIDEVDRDDDVRAVILTGRGRAFCAGADLSAGAATFDYDSHPGGGDLGGKRVADVAAPRDGAGLVTLRLFECHKPVISAVNGPAVGMGATMTLATDIRLAAASARFGFVFARPGLGPAGAPRWFPPRLGGLSQAAEDRTSAG